MARPLGLDWRDSAAYDYVDGLTHEQHAFEYLRRNPDYAEAYRRMMDEDHTGRTEAAEQMAEPWGLRFRGRPKPARRSRRCCLAIST